jgi:hypothetical protein
VYFEELRNGLLPLSLLIMGEKEIEEEWQIEYIKFLRGLSEDRIKVIESQW